MAKKDDTIIVDAALLKKHPRIAEKGWKEGQKMPRTILEEDEAITEANKK